MCNTDPHAFKYRCVIFFYYIMKKSLLSVSVIAVALMLPAIATAAVIVNNGIAVNFTTNQQNIVYMTEGNGYAVANQSGYIGVYGNNRLYTNFSIELSSVPGSGYVVLTNVLEIYNSSTSSGTVNVWINGSLPSGVTMYESPAPLAFNGTAISGKAILGNGAATSEIHLTKAGYSGYIGFVMTGAVSGSATFTLQYVIS